MDTTDRSVVDCVCELATWIEQVRADPDWLHVCDWTAD